MGDGGREPAAGAAIRAATENWTINVSHEMSKIGQMNADSAATLNAELGKPKGKRKPKRQKPAPITVAELDAEIEKRR